jgi:hypothetical protein
MAIDNFYESDGFDQNMDVSASTRKFQQSVIVKQDPNKSGILSFVKNLDKGASNQTNNEGTY